MKYAVEMGSGAVIYIPNFLKIGLDIQMLIRGWGFIDTQLHGHTESMEIARAYFKEVG
jgi:hypothetical protein